MSAARAGSGTAVAIELPVDESASEPSPAERSGDEPPARKPLPAERSGDDPTSVA
jgi:hypothetical protein